MIYTLPVTVMTAGHYEVENKTTGQVDKIKTIQKFFGVAHVEGECYTDAMENLLFHSDDTCVELVYPMAGTVSLQAYNEKIDEYSYKVAKLLAREDMKPEMTGLVEGSVEVVGMPF